MEPADGEMVIAAILEAQARPVVRPVDRGRLDRRSYRPRPPAAPVVEVPAVPEPSLEPEATRAPERETSDHTEIQYLLLRLGSDLGLSVWAAQNDRSREFRGERFADIKGMRADLPRQFDTRTNRTIALIDVLWLRGDTIVAAFEVESTTSIYSGLLRLADLIALQPNLKIPLYLVAPDERQAKVISEVNRPTFSHLDPPMSKVTSYISFSTLRARIAQTAAFVGYLKPDFVAELAESLDGGGQAS